MADQTMERIKKICAALPEVEIRGGQHHKLSVRDETMGWHPKTLAKLVP